MTDSRLLSSSWATRAKERLSGLPYSSVAAPVVRHHRNRLCLCGFKAKATLCCTIPPAPSDRSDSSNVLFVHCRFDWGKEVGGFTTLAFGSSSDRAQSVSLAYSESSYYFVGGDHSNGGSGPDGLISSGPIEPNSTYTVPANHMRGGFRYLNLVLETEGFVEISMPSIHFAAAPNMANPAAWENHFYSSDDTLNRIWCPNRRVWLACAFCCRQAQLLCAHVLCAGMVADTQSSSAQSTLRTVGNGLLLRPAGTTAQRAASATRCSLMAPSATV